MDEKTPNSANSSEHKALPDIWEELSESKDIPGNSVEELYQILVDSL